MAFTPPRHFALYQAHMNRDCTIEITMDRDSIMQIIQEPMHQLEPSMKVICRVSYQEGHNPLIYSLSGQVELFEVRNKIGRAHV